MDSEIIKKALQEVTGVEDIQLSFADRAEHGDYTTNIAMQMGKSKEGDRDTGLTPRQHAEAIVQRLEENNALKTHVEKIEIAGPGFINFFLADETLMDSVMRIIKEESKYGQVSINAGKKVIVEYSSPNIAKPFTVGHLRSTIIGDVVANLLSATGYTVYRDNHLGDWGTQFGKQIYAIKTWGDEAKIDASEAPVKELVSLYVKFHEEAEKDPAIEDAGREWFSKLEKGDKEARRLWQKCIDWSWQEFSKIYAELGIKFTENGGRGYGESFFEDKMETVLVELQEKSLLKSGKEGAQIVEFENDMYPPLMIVKKDGASLYATRDLATDKWRLAEYGRDTLIINEVGAEQSLYFRQLFELERMLGWVEEGQRVHLKHGLFRFADKKMSTRKGNVIWLQDVLSQAYEKAKELGSTQEIAKTIAVGALKWNELKRDPVNDIVFDWKDILNMHGNSGPYLQYTCVRIKSLLLKSKEGKTKPAMEKLTFDNLENEVVRYLVRFPQIVAQSAHGFHPSLLAEYLYNLAQKYNSLYDEDRIIGGDREYGRLIVSKATEIVLTNGLGLLGIQIPVRM